MMKKPSLQFSLLFAICLLLAFAGGCGKNSAVTPLPVGDFRMPSALNSEDPPYHFTAKAENLRLLLFIHPEDPICLNALATTFANLQREYAMRGVLLLAAIPTIQSHPAVAEAVAALNLPFPTAYASPEMTAAFGGSEKLRSIPTLFLLLPGNATPARAYTGYPDLDRLRADLDAALAGRPLPPLPPEYPPPEENPA